MDGPGLKTSLSQPPPARMRVFRAIATVTVTSIALVGAEMLARVIDGYRLGSIRLELSRNRMSPPDSGRKVEAQKWWGGADAWPYVEKLPTAAGVDASWFLAQPPARPLSQPDPDLEARARRYTRIPLEA